MEHHTPDTGFSKEIAINHERAQGLFEIAEGIAASLESAANSHPEAKDVLLELVGQLPQQIFNQTCDLLQIDEPTRRSIVLPGERYGA
jgi:hypothetical protein